MALLRCPCVKRPRSERGRAPGARLTGGGCSQWLGRGGAAAQVWGGAGGSPGESGVPALPPPVSHVSPQRRGVGRPSSLRTASPGDPTRPILSCLAHDVSKRQVTISHSHTPP